MRRSFLSTDTLGDFHVQNSYLGAAQFSIWKCLQLILV